MTSKTKLFIILLSLCCVNLSAQVTSNFNTDDDGWTVYDANGGTFNPPVYNSIGGNPSGNVSFTTASGSVNFFWNAPAKFLGNLGRAYNQNLTFDLQQSVTGSDNLQNDIILSGTSGVTLVYQLPAKPSTGWTSYTIQLNESFAGWHVGSYLGAAPTKDQIKSTLSTLNKFQIRLKYLAGAGAYTAQLDNVILNTQAVGNPPLITSFSPASALAGAAVTINGSNFNTVAAQNIVQFHGMKAVVTSATATKLVVTVPVGAPYGNISITDLSTGLQGTSIQCFNLLYDNNKDFGGQIVSSSMYAGYNTLLPMGDNYNSFGGIQQGDIDGDGWVDLVVTEISTQKIFAYRNLGTGGTVSVSSFASPVTLPAISSIPGGSPNLGDIIVADFDNDGKLDLAAETSSASSGYFALFRNTSTPGTISFGAPDFFSYAYYSSQGMINAGDLDGDGKIDLLVSTGTSPGGIWINQNLSSPGTIDFTFGVPLSVSTNNAHTDLLIGDMNGDHKPEIIAPSGTSFEIYENNSSAGVITMKTHFNYATTISGITGGLADLDNDNKLDLFWSGNVNTLYISKNIYSGVFDATAFDTEVAISSKLSNHNGLSAGDINSDGKIDIIAVGTYDIAVHQNVGTTGTIDANSFSPARLFQGSAGTQAIGGLGPVIADLDGDNKPEVAMVYSSSTVTAVEKGIYIFHNESYPVPVINNVTPSTGSAGNSIALSGDLMNTGSVSPTVRLGRTLVNVTGNSNTNTDVTIPTGAVSNRFLVTEHGLTGYSKPFSVTFGTNHTLDNTSFSSGVDFVLGNNTRDAIDVADFDDDGKVDVAVIDNFSTAKILKNTQATAGQPIAVSSLTIQGTTYSSGYNLLAMDMDGDGKVDLNSGGGLLKNNSTAGSIAFLSSVTTNAGGYNYASATDINKDGKTDIAVTNGTANIQVYENQSVRGSFISTATSFSTFNSTVINFAKPNNYGGIVAADFDGDGYDDILSANQTAGNISYFLNQKQIGPITTSSLQFLGNYSTSGSQPINLTANDFDGDGMIDIAVAYYNSAFVSVYRNTSSAGDITFDTPVDLPSANKGYGIASQDLDGDGLAEIVVIHRPNPGPGTFTVFQNKSTSGSIAFNTGINYALTAARNPQAVAIADINQDEKPDILIVGDPYTAPNAALMVFENKIVSGPTIAIDSQPTSTSACDGTNANFTTAASGTTNISYQWQKYNGTIFNNITNTSGYSGTATATLTINTTGNFGAGDYRCKVSGDNASDAFSNTVTLTVNAVPAAPTTSGNSDCVPASIFLQAFGGVNGQYRWYTTSSGGTPIVGAVNSSYTTPVINSTTNYYVAINDGFCESARTLAVAAIIPLAKPSINSSVTVLAGKINICEGDHVTLTGPGGYLYNWSDGSSLQQVIINQSIIITLFVSDEFGCSSPSSDAINIVVNPFPDATITNDGTTLTVPTGDSYQWYSSGEIIEGATGQSYEYNALEYGAYNVDVTTNGCTSQSDEYVYLITGIENSPDTIEIHPNPVKDELFIQTSAQKTLCTLIDLLGKNITTSIPVNEKMQKIDMRNVPLGTYILKVESTKKSFHRIIKID